MVLYFIGLGLGDEKDITVKGLEKVKQCDFLYLESYTSVLACQKESLEAFYQKEIIEADRIMVESGCDEMLERAKNGQVGFLVVGDPFGATTHADLYIRAVEKEIEVEVVHNVSIFNSIAITGLQLYRFGETVSVPFFTENWRPYSFYQKILKNLENNLHTLVLLDIKVKEQSEEDMIRGRLVFQPPRFMSAAVAAQQILEAETQTESQRISPSTLAVATLRVGTSDQRIVIRTLGELSESEDLGGPLHSLIIPAELHEIEEQMLNHFKSAS